MDERLEQELESRVEALGYEFVELERAGSKGRPILRVRIDIPDSGPGKGVSVEDCTKVSRALETYLDEQPGLSENYMLEVSSPGIERPLVRARDYERFAGQEVAVKTTAPQGEKKQKRFEGELLGIAGESGAERVRLQLKNGEVMEIPRAQIARAHLVFRWE